jgi:hypothetical protein
VTTTKSASAPMVASTSVRYTSGSSCIAAIVRAHVALRKSLAETCVSRSWAPGTVAAAHAP